MVIDPGLDAYIVATTELSVGAFDSALFYQLESKDDATFALWSGVGLETATLAGVLLASPAEAFQDGEVPVDDDLQTLEFRTARFSKLAEAAQDLYSEVSYPKDAGGFMQQVRNKLLHVGRTQHVGLVARSLGLIDDVGQWLQGVALPRGPLRHEPRVVEATRLEEIPGGLRAAAQRVAADNVQHLQSTLSDGDWDDTPKLKKIAQQELDECQRLSSSV